MQAAGGLHTLQSLYRSGFAPAPVPAMSWQPLMDADMGFTNATEAANNLKIHLPPIEEAYEDSYEVEPQDGPRYEDRVAAPEENKERSLLSKLFNRRDRKGHGGGLSSGGDHGPFGKVGRGGEAIWLESYSYPGAQSGHHNRRRRLDAKRRHDQSSSSGGRGLKGKIKAAAKGKSGKGGKGLFKEDRKGESIWLESSSNYLGGSSSSGGKPYHKKKGYGSSSSSSGGYWGKPDGKGGCYCSIGRSEKGDDAALITLGSIGIPLAIVGSILGGALGSGAFASIINATLGGIAGITGRRFFVGRGFEDDGFGDWDGPLDLLDNPLGLLNTRLTEFAKFMRNPIENLQANIHGSIGRSIEDGFSVLLWKFATRGFGGGSSSCFEQARDLGSDMEFIDENEIVLRMLDDLMMTYKYGYVPKCTRSHICKLNKAAASGGQPQSTIVPLMSLPAAWLLGKPSSNVMDFLHAVWLGRNEKDCDEVYPECSDIYSSLRFRGGGANSTDTELEADLHMDELLNDLRYLEENNQMAPAAETNQDRKEDDPKEEKTT